ncbi:unnamed protein product [Peronospora farinosa]|uniref:Uncharacterized protein n=1 Tax=Peronospora farinosa TaxID=134698 RepID=A0ABN8BXK5_9STRA|nr:unnamed protein product [Peronospora farinosa]
MEAGTIGWMTAWNEVVDFGSWRGVVTDGDTLQYGHRDEGDAFDDQDDVVVAVTLLVAGIAQYRSHHATDGEDASTAETVPHESEKEEEELPRRLAKY